MKNWMYPFAFALLSMLALWGCGSRGAADDTRAENEMENSEGRVSLDAVPAPVRATILREAGDNDIDEIEVETENGRAVYEAEWTEDGKEVEIEVAADGTLLEREVGDDESGDNADDTDGGDDGDDDGNGAEDD